MLPSPPATPGTVLLQNLKAVQGISMDIIDAVLVSKSDEEKVASFNRYPISQQLTVAAWKIVHARRSTPDAQL